MLRKVLDIARGILWDRLVNGLICSPWIPPHIRWRMLRSAGMDMAKCKIAGGVWFGSEKVSIGGGTFVNYGCWFDAYDQITIGREVRLGPHVVLCTSTHQVGGHEQRAGATTGAPVVIGDGAWIGARATILPGVTVAPGCIIAAGATVTEDCEPDGLYAGIPASRVRDLEVAQAARR